MGDGSAGGAGEAGAVAAPGTLTAVIRDFRFYSSSDPTTDPDFENPPYDIDQNGDPSPGYQGPWDDHGIVSEQLGGDGTPVYAGDPRTAP